jgi:hypothetical protein
MITKLSHPNHPGISARPHRLILQPSWARLARKAPAGVRLRAGWARGVIAAA